MQKVVSAGIRCMILGIVVCIFMPICADTGNPLGPMAGAGGVMRDAERRVMTSVVPHAEQSVVDVSSEAVKDKDEDHEEKSAMVVGSVDAVQIFGSIDFAAREDIGNKIMDVLGGGPKTAGEIVDAISKVRQDLLKKGYYLVRMSPLRGKGKGYDAKTATLKLSVDEGRFGKTSISFEGREDGTWFSKEQIESRFKNVKEGETFDYSLLRGDLFDANAHPDLTIDTSIDVRKPIEGEGENRRIVRYADLNLDVRERFPFHMVWEVNNYGMEEVEEWQTSMTLQYLNLTKHDDVLTISPSMSFGAELMSIAGSYMLPHDYWFGGATTLYGGYSMLDVDDVVPRLDLEGTGWFSGFQHTENLYNNDRHLFAASVGILWRWIEDQYTALGYALNERSTSILPVSMALSYTGKKADFMGGRNFATVQGLYNVATTGDKLEELWTGAEEHYWIFRWQLARLQPLFGWFDEKRGQDLHQWMIFTKVEGQYTGDTLIPVEKLSMGGYNCMRGYRTRGYIGDYGVYGTTELRTPILVDGFASLFGDRTDKTPIDRLQFLGFMDYGWTAFNDLPSSYDDSEFIYSAGVGVRAALTKYLQFRCDLAFPLRDTDWAEDENMEIYISVQGQF